MSTFHEHEKNIPQAGSCFVRSPVVAHEASGQTEHLLQQLEALLQIGLALSAEKDLGRLLQMIVSEARRLTNCDAGTLYLRQGEHLLFKVIQNDTLGIYQGGDGGRIDLPPVPLSRDNVSAYAALTGQTINIADVYNCDLFDFSGPCRYDKITGYRTCSMLVVPMQDHSGAIIGVLQLINALDAQRKTIVPFPAECQRLIEALASQAAVALTNASLLKNIEDLFHSFIQVMATAIDACTPYNAHHTRRVALLARATALAIDRSSGGRWREERFPAERLEQLTVAGWLHDIGKIAVPLSIMDKATRLGNRLPLVMQRLELAIWQARCAGLQEELELIKSGSSSSARNAPAGWEERLAALAGARELVLYCDHPATLVTPELAEKLHRLAEIFITDSDGNPQPLLTGEEIQALTVPRGTLTAEERKIMEEHVLITGRMLDKIKFTGRLQDVPRLATMHHEMLDGSGYPQGLQGEEIPLEARILAMVDIFDALTAHDRPYKKALPLPVALGVLREMAGQGKLDAELVELFIEERVWEEVWKQEQDIAGKEKQL